jgi:hypothetical protein
MLQRLSFILSVALAVIAFDAVGARAQTVAAGPYYATPSWDQTLTCTTSANCPRFIVLSNFGGAAVLDRETGLVWERSPLSFSTTWDVALITCDESRTGGRFGWRLPSVHELASLSDPASPLGVTVLPSGHPFQGVVLTLPSGNNAAYWSAGALSDTSQARLWNFGGLLFAPQAKSELNLVWCVRGGGAQ